MAYRALVLCLLFNGLIAFSAELTGVNHAESCGRCHRDILQAWKFSAHAKAMANPRFQDALERAEAVGGTRVRRTCLGCHAPTVQYSDDWELKTKATWEGVTCDFCHSLKSVSLEEGVATLNIRFDGVKTGPLREASSMAHRTAYSEVHTSSLVCAGCHEYRNQQGFAVLTTYSEWQNSRYGREGVNCQDCHMAETAANVVDPKVKRLTQTTVNLHEMPGSRSIDQLNKALLFRLDNSREGDEVVIQVDLTNRGAGHAVPTGSPLRRVNLEVTVRSSDGKSFREERSYWRQVADSKGAEIHSEELTFLQGARTITDTRLQPEEKRQEVFRFPIPASRAARINARLSYHYSPREDAEEVTSLNFITLTGYVPAKRGRD